VTQLSPNIFYTTSTIFK